MIEFWAAIGLACLDHVFLEQLREHQDDVETVVRNYGFRLSRWEMGELKRVIQLGDKFFDNAHRICELWWEDAFNPKDTEPCWWSAERSNDISMSGGPQYRHPLVNGEPVPRPGGRQY